MKEARWALNAAPALFNPYKALTIMAFFPASCPNSGPRTVQTFSVIGAVMYAFKTSPTFTWRSFNAAYVNAIRTVSRDTTLAYVIVSGAFVWCPPATKRAFLWKFSIFTSNIIWQWIRWYPFGARSPSGRILNAARTFFISLAIASAQRVLPFILSNSSASSTDFGTAIPNLWVRFK